jgi:hypothetical protein
MGAHYILFANFIEAFVMEDFTADELAILRHFKDKGLRLGDFELPGAIRALLNDDERTEAALTALEGKGILALGPERHRFEPHGVRAAALTRIGMRLVTGLSD